MDQSGHAQAERLTEIHRQANASVVVGIIELLFFFGVIFGPIASTEDENLKQYEIGVDYSGKTRAG